MEAQINRSISFFLIFFIFFVWKIKDPAEQKKCMIKNKTELHRVIPLVTAGNMSISIAAKISGYSTERIRVLAKNYKIYGDAAFIHHNTGKAPVNKTPYNISRKIVSIYKNDFAGVNFLFFRDMLEEYYDIKISYNAVYLLLTSEGIISPENHKIKKVEDVHRPRRRRNCEGELVQMDGTPYQWFSWAGDNAYYCLHCAIDDATSKVTALYMCENECYYGYTELVRRTFYNYGGGHPCAIYTDRAAIFKTPERQKYNTTIAEDLKGKTKHETQWQRMMREVGVEMILAWSPQAKGRVERLNSTLQKRLPWYFKHYGIKTLEQANAFLLRYVDIYNKQFAVEPYSPIKVWHKTGYDSDYILSQRYERTTTYARIFSFEGYKWELLCKNAVHAKFELCINEHGIRGYYQGKWYDVRLVDDYQGAHTQVLDAIISKYFLSDVKEKSA